MRISRRIPDVIVGAIDDSGEMLASLPQNAVEAAAQGLCLDLLGICRAHRGEPIGKNNSRLQQIQLAVKFHLVEVEILPIQASEEHVPVPENALISQVVDRQQ